MTGCRCCGADFSREGHLPNCENNPPLPEEDEVPSDADMWEDWDREDEYQRANDDNEGGPDFDPYAGQVIFDDGGDDSE